MVSLTLTGIGGRWGLGLRERVVWRKEDKGVGTEGREGVTVGS